VGFNENWKGYFPAKPSQKIRS